MSPTLDQAIITALNIDPSTAKMSHHGTSLNATTLKITAGDKLYFIKTASGRDAEVMFAGEHASLNAIHDIVPSFCPRSYAYGALSTPSSSPFTSSSSSSTTSSFFLASDFLSLKSATKTHNQTRTFAQKLAQLHSTPAPIPPGHITPQYGFPCPTTCGSTPQPNTYTSSWADFFAKNRLAAIMAASDRKNGRDAELSALMDRVVSVVVPRLLREGHLGGTPGIVPVVVHGDLWSGNHGRGRIGDGEAIEEVVFDPCCCYAHSEYDLGIMRMFGGFSDRVMAEYHALKAKDEPADEYEDRVALYEMYHHMNHHTMFGGGYRAGAVSIMRRLLGKYGDEE